MSRSVGSGCGGHMARSVGVEITHSCCQIDNVNFVHVPQYEY